jgi:hypothetical protein
MRLTNSILTRAFALFVLARAATAQENTYTSDSEGYSIEFPSATWKALPRPDSKGHHTEFVNGDRTDGYLRIRQEIMEDSISLTDFARGQADTKLRFLPGYVVGGRETPFTGRLKGIVTTYEFTTGGKPMVGRIYYLHADPRTVYVLHFQGARDRLQRIQNQTDAIARSFQAKN